MGAVHDSEEPLGQRLRGAVLAVELHRSHAVGPGEAHVRQVRPGVGRYLEREVREGRVRLLFVVGLVAARPGSGSGSGPGIRGPGSGVQGRMGCHAGLPGRPQRTRVFNERGLSTSFGLEKLVEPINVVKYDKNELNEFIRSQTR